MIPQPWRGGGYMPGGAATVTGPYYIPIAYYYPYYNYRQPQ